MQYNEITLSQTVVHHELTAYLRENRSQLVLPTITGHYHSDITGWINSMRSVGIQIDIIVDKVFDRLISSQKAEVRPVSVDNSTTAAIYNAYFPLRCKFIIMQEVLELVRMGVLMQVKVDQRNKTNYEFTLNTLSDSVILTDYGLKFTQNNSSSPYFAEQYLDNLNQITELDSDLRNYLSEGVACLHHHLNRAAAILLRSALEHTLGLLIDSTMKAIQNESERSSFEQSIKKTRNNIEESRDSFS